MRRVACSLRIASVIVLLGVARAEAQEAVPAVPPGYQYPPQQYSPQQPPPQAQPQVVQAAPTQRVLVVPAYGAQPSVAAQPAPRVRAVQVEHTESIRGLWLPGVIALPIAWVSTWTAASTYFLGDALTFSWIPVVGPWLMLTTDVNGFEAPIVISGVVQGAAALMIVLGLAIQRTRIDTEYVVEPPTVSFDVAPIPGGGYCGSVSIRL